MTIFDAIVVFSTLVAVWAGARAGLLRSLARIIGYAIAAPCALALTPKIAPLISRGTPVSGDRGGVLFFIILVITAWLFTALLRTLLDEYVSPDVSLPDRIAGGVLGAVRTILLAILMVAIFERIIPRNQEPAWLAQSRLRPPLSRAGQAGLRSLPASVTSTIDKLKRERGL